MIHVRFKRINLYYYYYYYYYLSMNLFAKTNVWQNCIWTSIICTDRPIESLVPHFCRFLVNILGLPQFPPVKRPLQLKVHSHCDGNDIFLCRCHCCHEWVQYRFMTAMEKKGIMESIDGVHTAAAMAMEKTDFFSPFRCHCHRSVNEPLGWCKYHPSKLAMCTLWVLQQLWDWISIVLLQTSLYCQF